MIKKFEFFNESTDNESLSKWFDDPRQVNFYLQDMSGKCVTEDFNEYELKILSDISDKIEYLHNNKGLLRLRIGKYCKIQIEKMYDEWYVITTTIDSIIHLRGYFVADGIRDAIKEIKIIAN